MPEDIIDIEILPDGTIKTTTPKVSAANHGNANEFMKMMARLTGGDTTTTKRVKHVHTHEHEKGTTKA